MVWVVLPKYEKLGSILIKIWYTYASVGSRIEKRDKA